MYNYVLTIAFLFISIVTFSQKENSSYLKFKLAHIEVDEFEEDLYVYVDNKIVDTVHFDTKRISFGIQTKVGKFNILIKSNSFRAILIKDVIMVSQKITFIEEPLPLVRKTNPKDRKKTKMKYEKPIFQGCG